MFTCSDIEVVGRKDQIGRSGELLEAASFIAVVNRLFTCVAGHLDYQLALDSCCSEFLHNCLPCGVVSQFLFACFQRCVLDNPHHHIINAVYTELLFLVPDICFSVSNYGQLKRTFVSQLLRTSAKVLLQQVNRTFRTQTRLLYAFLFTRFVTLYRVVRARILPVLG